MRRTTSVLLALCIAVASHAPLTAQKEIGLPAMDRGLVLPTRTLFQVGELEGEEYENFAGVTDVVFDAAGNLYVLDATAHRVIVFDAAGRFLRTIGRQGDGPGEYGSPQAIAVMPNGELVVNDAGKANLQVFGPDGAFRRTVVLDDELGRANGRMRVSTDGRLITETAQLRRIVNQAEAREVIRQVQLPPRSVTRLSLGQTATGQRLFNAAPRNLQLGPPKTSGGNMHVAMSINAFLPSLLWTPIAGGGVAALNTQVYRVTITAPDGRALQHLERPIEPRKVTAADRKRFLEKQKNGTGPAGAVAMFATARAAGAGPGHSAPAPPARLSFGTADIKESDVTWNDVIPVISGLGTDSFGRLWVQRTGLDLGDGPIDVIDANNSYLGTLAKQQLPRAFGPGGRLAYIIKDDLDVQRVVVKQLLR